MPDTKNILFKKPFSLVPLIDIIFLLLIFFLVVAAIISRAYEKERQVYVTLAVPTHGTSSTDAVLYLYRAKFGTYFKLITAQSGKDYNPETIPTHRVTYSNLRWLYQSGGITPQMNLLIIVSSEVKLSDFAKLYDYCLARSAGQVFSIKGNENYIRNKIYFVQKRHYWNRHYYEKW